MLALQELAAARKTRISSVKTSHKAKFAQYLTPLEIARYMAQITREQWEKVRHPENAGKIAILDPGAGSGILSCCLADELCRESQNTCLTLDAYEVDDTILPDLARSYRKIGEGRLQYKIHKEDFITDIGHDIYWNIAKKYDLIIMNPPYKKINANSKYRKVLHDIGIETVNTYSAFMAIAIKLLSENGILTAIVPRSFCNGLYFLPFRKFVLDNTAILHIHSFAARNNAFSDENVLQENIIITLKKTAIRQKTVTVSFSKDKLFTDYTEKKISCSQIVNPGDTQLYIAIPTKNTAISRVELPCFNTDLAFDISTGPVVDFRLKEKLIFDEPSGGVPLLYAIHVRNQEINWPQQSKKPNAILLDDTELKKIAFPKGYYILVKRFSSKEERRRIYATLLEPNSLPAEYFTVENHLNIIHCKHGGLNKDIAVGLTVYFNTAYCDALFRNFSGHTQVNATDLRNMKYPSPDVLVKLGQLTQGKRPEDYDQILERLVLKNAG